MAKYGIERFYREIIYFSLFLFGFLPKILYLCNKEEKKLSKNLVVWAKVRNFAVFKFSKHNTGRSVCPYALRMGFYYALSRYAEYANPVASLQWRAEPL